MKGFKILTLCAAAMLFLAPATAMAKTHFSFSVNLFDCLPRVFVPVPPPVPVYERVIVPCPLPQPYVEHRTIVKEYHFYGCERPEYCQTIQPQHPGHTQYPKHQASN